jgi:hypothetical protein
MEKLEEENGSKSKREQYSDGRNELEDAGRMSEPQI